MTRIDPPHPYFGSKAFAADRIWEAFGDPSNFVDAACGSNAVLYARPRTSFEDVVETVNDAWGFIPNFLRAVRANPRVVAQFADWPVSELDLQARHRWLLERVDESFVDRLRNDERFFDAKVAGYWVYGQSIWIGSGWCDPRTALSRRRLPYVQGAGTASRDRHPHYGRGIFRRQLPAPGATPVESSDPQKTPLTRRRDTLSHYFRLIAARLERVRIVCGDWRRVLTPAVTISHGLTAVLLDPPYGPEAARTANLYALDSDNLAADMRTWAVENGINPLFRIVLCGYEGEHEELASHGWRAAPWRNRGGLSVQDGEHTNIDRERLWLSPHCIGGSAYDGPLFRRTPDTSCAF